jgi:hypothetical protein
MIVESRVVGERGALADVEVSLAGGDHALGEVLDALVAHEVGRYEARRHERSLLRVLTPADLVRAVDTGTYAAEPRHVPPAPSVEDAQTRAREAFGDGLYYVFIDDQQVESLEATVRVGPDTRLRLIRLVALAGG